MKNAKNKEGQGNLSVRMRICLFLLAFLILAFIPPGRGLYPAPMTPESGSIKVTILYDNYSALEGTKTDWGFSCLVEGADKTILFDTGTQGDILWHNIKALNVDIDKVDLIVISHLHGDHTGGLASVLEKNPRVTVYLPASAPEAFVQSIQKAGASVERAKDPQEISKNVYLTGEMRDRANEQSLFLETGQGVVIMTGCAHPGIVSIIKKAMEIIPKKPYAVFGGFHLGDRSNEEILAIIQEFRKSGVSKCGPTHCSGDQAIKLFKQEYGPDFLTLGTGRILEFPW